MKKLVLSLFAVFVSLSAFSANNIKMVTYFPVPYASYQNLDVEKTLDVGVMSCALNLTCPANQYALNVYEDVNPGSSVLKQGYLRVTSGALNLNSTGKAVSKIMSVGSQSGSGGELSFGQNLRIDRQSNRGESLQATNESNTVTALHLFPDHINNNFPACSGVEGAPDVSWQRLELGAKDGKAVSNVFLVCGRGKGGEAEEEPEPEPEKKDCPGNLYQQCGCGNQGTQSRSCNYETGTWSAWGKCSVPDTGCGTWVAQRNYPYGEGFVSYMNGVWCKDGSLDPAYGIDPNLVVEPAYCPIMNQQGGCAFSGQGGICWAPGVTVQVGGDVCRGFTGIDYVQGYQYSGTGRYKCIVP